MKTAHLGRILGIDVFIHWTFYLLLVWIGGSVLLSSGSLVGAMGQVMLVVCVFACVLAHEYGHALAARRYGIPTEDITLFPIGGVARLRSIPERPLQELVVALAGPAVNVVIAALLGFVLFVVEALQFNLGAGLTWMIQSLLGINIALVVFNLLPAFPMDGGRVLRAFLALRMNRVRATDLAASVGKFMAIVFGVLGLFTNPMLILIAVFVYFGAGAEAAQVRAVEQYRARWRNPFATQWERGHVNPDGANNEDSSFDPPVRQSSRTVQGSPADVTIVQLRWPDPRASFPR